MIISDSNMAKNKTRRKEKKKKKKKKKRQQTLLLYSQVTKGTSGGQLGTSPTTPT